MAERIAPEDGVVKLENGEALFVDVRDPASHQEARIPGSVLLNQANLEDFLAATDRQQPLVVYCYHGHSSQGKLPSDTEESACKSSIKGVDANLMTPANSLYKSTQATKKFSMS